MLPFWMFNPDFPPYLQGYYISPGTTVTELQAIAVGLGTHKARTPGGVAHAYDSILKRLRQGFVNSRTVWAI